MAVHVSERRTDAQVLPACSRSRASGWKRRSESVNMRGNAIVKGGVVAVVYTDADTDTGDTNSTYRRRQR